jgi:hypothetical protein
MSDEKQERQQEEESYEDFVIFEDEVQLVGWDESDRAGMTVRLRIPSVEYDVHPFKRFPQGSRFFARMIEIGDDGEPVNQAMREKLQKALQEREVKGGKNSKDAGILCGDVEFQRWVILTMSAMEAQDKRTMAAQIPPQIVKQLKDRGGDILRDKVQAGELAKWFVYITCRIKSRRELDHKADALNRYEQFVLRPYFEWRRKQ